MDRFKSLCTLKLRNCRGIESQSIAQLPLLHTLSLRGEGMALNMEVCHRGLRSLEVFDWSHLVSPQLNCPSLEILILKGPIILKRYLERLRNICPALKNLSVNKIGTRAYIDEIGSDPLNFVHETLEELILISIFIWGCVSLAPT